MISHFFIDRPIFAAVLSIVITIAGGVAVTTLPIAQYPDVTPPTVLVTALYPGANSQTVRDTVAQPIEQQVSGVENMLYMSSQCTNDGLYTLTITFKMGMNSDMAQVLVQNRVSLAQPVIPDLVQREGINVKKQSPNTLMIVNLFSPDGSHDDIYLSNYATIQIKDELGRLPGVANIGYMGQRDYSLRAWLDPERMASLGINASDVSTAINEQNIQVAAGQIGQQPAPAGQEFQYTINTLGRLVTPEQFANIILKVQSSGGSGSSSSGGAGPTITAAPTSGSNMTGSTAIDPSTTFGGASSDSGSGAPPPATGSTGQMPAMPTVAGGGVSSAGAGLGGSTSTPSGAGSVGIGSATTGKSTTGVTGTTSAQSVAGPPSFSILRLRDIASVQLGSQQYDQSCTLDGKPSVALTVYQLPGHNSLETARGVYAKMESLKQRFPDGLDYEIVYDTTPFIRESVIEVFNTLRDAVILVAIVVLVFLQNWRAAIIPLVAVPVAVVGTFAVMAAMRFSLNNLSLFGLVLAIGIVVDDAIVVVENVERWLEHGLSPRDATRRAMDEVTGPVIAVALVLTAVFVPCAFISGITGQFFRQFAVTIAASTLISAFNSLTLSPALAAILLRPRGAKRDPIDAALNFLLGWFFKLFNMVFDLGNRSYTFLVGGMLRASVLVFVVFGGLLVATYVEFDRTPTGFIPQQDKGYLLVNVQLPDSASVSRTQAVVRAIERIAQKTNGVAHTVSVAGQSLILNVNAPNLGSIYVMLAEFHQRPGLGADDIAASLRSECGRQVQDALVTVFGAPPIDGLGTTGGFKMIVEDRGNEGLAALQTVSDAIVRVGNASRELTGLFTSSRAYTPWLYLDIDREKCLSLGLSMGDVFNTLQIFLGSYYVNNFNDFGRSWQVNIMADPRFRDHIEEIKLLRVRTNQGYMAPLGTVIQVRDASGPAAIMRYNMYASAAISGNLAPGVSSTEAIARMESIAREKLPRSMSFAWTELAFMQQEAGSSAMGAFGLAVVFVFLVLAAQYESWNLPLAVILVVPMCLLSSVIGIRLAGMEINIFTQIGFIVLVGLASKNAILIVEFARQVHASGKSRREAALEACRLRLRPILMTSFAFILGVVPLVLAEGAGAEMRRTLGMAAFSGMLGVTIFGVFLTPVFYYTLQAGTDWWTRRGSNSAASESGELRI